MTLRSFIAILVIVFTRAIGAAAAEPPAAVLEAAAQASRPARHAFVVGIDSFADPGFPTLRWATSDARAIAGVLGREGEGWSIALVTAPETTAHDRLLQQLDAYLTSLGPDDTALVYVSSHGVVDYVDGRPRRYLVAQDTDPDDLPGTGIEVKELLARVDAAEPRWKVVILASCFGGAGDGVRSAPDFQAEGRRGAARLQPIDAWPRRATVVLSASYMDGPAWEDPELGHEIYTYYLLEALTRPADPDVDLNGDGALSAFEAHGYAAGNTVARTGGRQFPSANLDAVGERDVVLLGTPEAQPARAVFWSFLAQRRGDRGTGQPRDQPARRTHPRSLATVRCGRRRHHQGHGQLPDQLRDRGFLARDRGRNPQPRCLLRRGLHGPGQCNGGSVERSGGGGVPHFRPDQRGPGHQGRQSDLVPRPGRRVHPG